MQGTSEPKRRAGRRDDAPAEGYLDQDFARFRAERLRSTGRRAAVERAAAVEAADTEDPPPLEPRRVGPSPEAAAAPGAAVADETVALALPRADVERFERYREEVATPLRGNPVLPPAAVRGGRRRRAVLRHDAARARRGPGDRPRGARDPGRGRGDAPGGRRGARRRRERARGLARAGLGCRRAGGAHARRAPAPPLARGRPAGVLRARQSSPRGWRPGSGRATLSALPISGRAGPKLCCRCCSSRRRGRACRLHSDPRSRPIGEQPTS